jgi:hypothetical protein
MSLPSINKVSEELGITINESTSAEDLDRVLKEAMSKDMSLGIELLHRKSHEATETGQTAQWEFNPNSEIGRQLTRIHASDPLRRIASKHFCHGHQLTFVNCCKGFVGKPPENIALIQIQNQNGTTGSADC